MKHRGYVARIDYDPSARTFVGHVAGLPEAGTFHGATVKEGAYRPDWSEPSRLAYSNRLAGQLAALLPEGLIGSLSTVPGTFKPWAEDRVPAIADNLIRGNGGAGVPHPGLSHLS